MRRLQQLEELMAMRNDDEPPQIIRVRFIDPADHHETGGFDVIIPRGGGPRDHD
jgi:hypothetical protein